MSSRTSKLFTILWNFSLWLNNKWSEFEWWTIEHVCNKLSPYVFNPVVVCLPMLMTFWQHSYLMSGANRQKNAFLGNTQWSALISWTIERWPQRFDSLAWLAHNVQETIFLLWNIPRRIHSCVESTSSYFQAWLFIYTPCGETTPHPWQLKLGTTRMVV